MAFAGEAQDLVSIVPFLEQLGNAVRAVKTDAEKCNLVVSDKIVGRAVKHQRGGGNVVLVFETLPREDGS